MTNTFTTKNGDVFEMSFDLMDVTSMRRPDETWRYTDVRGHLHQWFEDGQPMERYRPDRTHDTPTLVWVKDGEEYWEGDDEPHPVGHNECRECGEHIEPRYTADTTTQYVAGLLHCRINGQVATREEFERQFKESQ